MTTPWQWVTASGRAALAGRLAAEVAALLGNAIATRGRAGLAVPGGTTPRVFLAALGRRDLDWDRVGVTLTDERAVPAGAPRSNQRLLAETLFAGPAAAAEFVPLHAAAAEPADALPAVAASLRRVALPLDICVLGMGTDGHTASLFPGALGAAAALDPACPEPVASIRAAGAPEPRITLTLPVLTGAGWTALLIHGPEKRAALEAAGRDAPVRQVLDAARDPVVYYAD